MPVIGQFGHHLSQAGLASLEVPIEDLDVPSVHNGRRTRQRHRRQRAAQGVGPAIGALPPLVASFVIGFLLFAIGVTPHFLLIMVISLGTSVVGILSSFE
jgi:hypothetical protein